MVTLNITVLVTSNNVSHVTISNPEFKNKTRPLVERFHPWTRDPYFHQVRHRNNSLLKKSNKKSNCEPQ